MKIKMKMKTGRVWWHMGSDVSSPCWWGTRSPEWHWLLCLPRRRPFWNWFDFEELGKAEEQEKMKAAPPLPAAPPPYFLQVSTFRQILQETWHPYGQEKHILKPIFELSGGKTSCLLREVKSNSNAPTAGRTHCQTVRLSAHYLEGASPQGSRAHGAGKQRRGEAHPYPPPPPPPSPSSPCT